MDRNNAKIIYMKYKVIKAFVFVPNFENNYDVERLMINGLTDIAESFGGAVTFDDESKDRIAPDFIYTETVFNKLPLID